MVTLLVLLVCGTTPTWGRAAPTRVTQEGGSWRLDFAIRYRGEEDLEFTPATVSFSSVGFVSNSRALGHGVPRLSRVDTMCRPRPLSFQTSTDWGGRRMSGFALQAPIPKICTEEAHIFLWKARREDVVEGTIADVALCVPDAPIILRLNPGDVLRVRAYLHHRHIPCGDYDPLLGGRDVCLTFHEAGDYQEHLNLDPEQYVAQPLPWWREPPAERRDDRYFHSPPDSLHIQAHIPGNQYYRFPERPVRYGTRTRLRFWYLIARGTEGQCFARVSQYMDTPTAWKVLNEGAHDLDLTIVGRWTKVERVFRTESDTTTLAIDFRINSNSDLGEMWIDDVDLVPLPGDADRNPENP
jgi:hypothetical protein